jgi:SAM-dependent methyltransferase
MLSTTVDYLKCPRLKKSGACSGELALQAGKETILPGGASEVVFGTLLCQSCRAEFPILTGVAVVVPDPYEYLLQHVKGVSRWVRDADIPRELIADFIAARDEIESEHIEEDLEAERVTSLYVMNHFLQAKTGNAWWKSGYKNTSPEIAEVVERFWDRGPFHKISELWGPEKRSLVELGCGVGGLYTHLSGKLSRYLGVDSSFASIALARKLALGLPQPLQKDQKVLVPGDLLNGIVSFDVKEFLMVPPKGEHLADFVVGDAVYPPVREKLWDVSASLNMIDMLSEPEVLPQLQRQMVRKGGLAIQSSPYVWHPETAKNVKKQTAQADSAHAVEALYKNAGFSINQSLSQVPWLFFKHVRQLEIYSVHLFFATSLKD